MQLRLRGVRRPTRRSGISPSLPASESALLSFDRKPSAACSRIRDAIEASGFARAISPEIGPMARALAASKKAGAFLCIGSGAGEIGAWVLDGMDHSSGLVVLVEEKREAAVIEREFDRDVRASVHFQDAAVFLNDVRAHRFHLIVDLIADEHPKIVRRGLGLLREGGVYLASHLGDLTRETLARCDQAPAGQISTFEPEDFEVASLGDPWNSLIIVRRVESIRKKRRARSTNR